MPDVQGTAVWFLARAKNFNASPKHSDQLWGPHSLLFKWYRWSFPDQSPCLLPRSYIPTVWWTYPKVQVAVGNKLCTVASKICEASVWYLLHVTLLVTRVLRWLIRFLENLCIPEYISITECSTGTTQKLPIWSYYYDTAEKYNNYIQQ